MTNFLGTLIATFFGSGLLPKAPGTWGSFFTIPVAYLLINKVSLACYFAIVIIVFLAGWWSASVYDKLKNTKDNKRIVIDETVGQLLAAMPIYLIGVNDIWWLCLAFVLFRLFDITKILGVSKCEEISGGLGVMADDVLAGVYAGIVLFVLFLGTGAL